jgi:hypothetical protein
MISDLFLQAVSQFVKERIETLSEEMAQTLDFAKFEQEVAELMRQMSTLISAIALTEQLASAAFLEQLKELGARKGMRFREYRTVTIYFATGKTARIPTPYFTKAKAKRGRKKRGPNGRGSHLGLEVLGLSGRSSAVLVSEVVKMAVLCPSFEVAQAMLAGRGIALDIATMRRFCRQLADQGIRLRGPVSLDGHEDLTGYTVVIGIDGGRLRERCPNRGRKKQGHKRQGYRGEWREPKLFTIYLVDQAGETVDAFSPLQDATLGDHKAMFTLLEQYLSALPLADADRVVFCGDGAPWIWSGVEALCQRLGLSDPGVSFQVLDYTHAKQNLHDILELVAKRVKTKEKLETKWHALLWNGDIQGLHAEICRVLTGRKQRAALKKWKNYFEENAKRMQYQAFKTAGLPCGSGCVESAVRRIINLRLKSAGTFWKREMAECFLFLRAQLLSGRWLIFLRNVTRQLARALLNLSAGHDVEQFQPVSMEASCAA